MDAADRLIRPSRSGCMTSGYAVPMCCRVLHTACAINKSDGLERVRPAPAVIMPDLLPWVILDKAASKHADTEGRGGCPSTVLTLLTCCSLSCPASSASAADLFPAFFCSTPSSTPSSASAAACRKAFFSSCCSAAYECATGCLGTAAPSPGPSSSSSLPASPPSRA